jgi:hypothetical protein
MPSKVYSAAVVGVDAFEVEIEAHAGWGNSDKIAVVGLSGHRGKGKQRSRHIRHLPQRSTMAERPENNNRRALIDRTKIANNYGKAHFFRKGESQVA